VARALRCPVSNARSVDQCYCDATAYRSIRRLRASMKSMLQRR
jgi:hypothetical protein